MGIGRNDMEKEQSALFATAVSLGAALLGGGAKLALDNMKATSVALIDSKISDNEAKKERAFQGSWLVDQQRRNRKDQPGKCKTACKEREKINFVSGAKVQKMILTETFCQKSTALSGYYNPGRLHIQYKYHFTKRRVLVLWWTTPTSENASVPAALQRA